MITHIKSPATFSSYFPRNKSVFLAGSIEMGTAEKWQDKVVDYLEKYKNDLVDVVVYNPRRDDWDSSWVQSQDNTKFKEQVIWEQSYLFASKINFFYFDPNTKSPITLMELGESVESTYRYQYYYGILKDLVVVCPPGFWRKGNVDIIVDRAGFRVFDDLDAGLYALGNLLKG